MGKMRWNYHNWDVLWEQFFFSIYYIKVKLLVTILSLGWGVISNKSQGNDLIIMEIWKSWKKYPPTTMNRCRPCWAQPNQSLVMQFWKHRLQIWWIPADLVLRNKKSSPSFKPPPFKLHSDKLVFIVQLISLLACKKLVHFVSLNDPACLFQNISLNHWPWTKVLFGIWKICQRSISALIWAIMTFNMYPNIWAWLMHLMPTILWERYYDYCAVWLYIKISHMEHVILQGSCTCG